MGKKKNKKENSLSSDKSNISIKDRTFDDQSSSNISANDSYENSGHFKILLYENIDEKDKYYKSPKNCSWRNIAFIHPSVLRDLHCGDFIFIKGNRTSAVFIAYPQKAVKKSSVVLLNDMGFEHEELVTVDPFEGEGYEADEISVVSLSEFYNNVNITDLLWKKLCNQFIWPGLKVELVFFDTRYEFMVTHIKSTDQVRLRNFSKNTSFLNQTSSCDISNLSGSAKANDSNINESELHLSSIFQSMTLQDDKNHSASEIVKKIPNFFVISHRSSVLFCEKTDEEKKLKWPLFEHIGGYKKEIERIKNYVKQFLELTKDELAQRHMLLLTGPQGTGKTMMLKAICNEYDVYTEVIEKNSLFCKETSDAVKEINQKFKNAAKRAPSFLLLDEFDRLTNTESQYSRISDTLCNLIAACDTKILILASVTTGSGYDKNVLNSVSVQEIKFSLPSTFEIEEIVGKILSGMKHELSSDQIKECAECFQGMSEKEIFRSLKYDASILSLYRVRNTSTDKVIPNEAVLTVRDIKTAVKRKKSQIMSSNLKTEKVLWSDIGGMDAIKEKLKEEIRLSQLTPEILKRFNYSPCRGILLYGPPGCSKTMIAKALATECNWNFISKKAPDIMNKYVGESEKAVVNLFLEARARSPCIIFLDEIEVLAPERSSASSSSGVDNRVVNAFLTEMDGIEPLKDVMVIAATNRPNIIDEALLRHGRLGQHIYVPLPDSATRKEIFKLSMKRRQVADEVDFDYLVGKTDGYTGAEIVNLCNEAALKLLLEDPECSSPIFQMKHFERALLAVPPRISKETIQFYEQFSLNS